jgi:hypothetical protein
LSSLDDCQGGVFDPEPANYQMAAGQSLQTPDDFLARQAQKPLPPAPLYTASTLTLPDAPD